MGYKDKTKLASDSTVHRGKSNEEAQNLVSIRDSNKNTQK